MIFEISKPLLHGVPAQPWEALCGLIKATGLGASESWSGEWEA